MSRMLRLAQLIEHKYGLTSQGAPTTPARLGLESEIAKAAINAKKELQNAFRTYFHGRDQVMLHFAGLGDKLVENYVKMWNGLGDPRRPENNIPADLFKRMFTTMLLGLQVHNNIGHFIDKLKDETPNLTHKTIEELNLRRSKLDGQLAALHGVLKNAMLPLKTLLQNVDPKLKDLQLPEAPVRKRRNLSRREITNFIQRNPMAYQYGLTEDVLSHLIQSDGLMYFPEEREKLITFINAVNSGKNPAGGPELFAKIKQITENMAHQSVTNQPYLEMPEEEFEATKQVYTDPAEQKSREMLRRKEEVGQERQEEAESEEALQRLAPQIQQRDVEYQQRMMDLEQQKQEEEERKKQEEEDLASKYSSLTFAQWIRR